MNFPTLTNSRKEVVTPSIYGFEDTTITSTIESAESEAGYVITRPRYSRTKKSFMVSYINVEFSVVSAVETFFRTQALGKANIFNWVHPKSGTTYTVRFNQDTFKLPINGELDKISFQFELITV